MPFIHLKPTFVLIQRYWMACMAQWQQLGQGKQSQCTHRRAGWSEHFCPAERCNSFWIPVNCSVFFIALLVALSMPRIMWGQYFSLLSSLTSRSLRRTSSFYPLSDFQKLTFSFRSSTWQFARMERHFRLRLTCKYHVMANCRRAQAHWPLDQLNRLRL